MIEGLRSRAVLIRGSQVSIGQGIYWVMREEREGTAERGEGRTMKDRSRGFGEFEIRYRVQDEVSLGFILFVSGYSCRGPPGRVDSSGVRALR